MQDYKRLVEGIVRHSGLDAAAILDIRGNHDDFDVPKRQGKQKAAVPFEGATSTPYQ